MILVDTSVWIDFLNGTKSYEASILYKLIKNNENICLTGIILTEILQGIKNEKDYTKTKNYLLNLPFYNSKDIKFYLNAAAIYRNCRKKGKTIRKTIDCIIAAICIEKNLILLHKDQDFHHIASCTKLRLLKPSKI